MKAKLALAMMASLATGPGAYAEPSSLFDRPPCCPKCGAQTFTSPGSPKRFCGRHGAIA